MDPDALLMILSSQLNPNSFGFAGNFHRWASRALGATMERDEAFKEVTEYADELYSQPVSQARQKILAVWSPTGGGKTHFMDFVAEHYHRNPQLGVLPVFLSFNGTTNLLKFEYANPGLAIANRILYR